MAKSAPRVMKRSDADFVPRFEYGEMAQAAAAPALAVLQRQGALGAEFPAQPVELRGQAAIAGGVASGGAAWCIECGPLGASTARQRGHAVKVFTLRDKVEHRLPDGLDIENLAVVTRLTKATSTVLTEKWQARKVQKALETWQRQKMLPAKDRWEKLNHGVMFK